MFIYCYIFEKKKKKKKVFQIMITQSTLLNYFK